MKNSFLLTTRALLLTLSFTSTLAFAEAVKTPSAKSVEPQSITIVQTTLRGSTKASLIACLGSVPGRVKQKNARLLFTSYTTLLKTTQNPQTVRLFKRLRTAGKALCSSGAGLTPSSFGARKGESLTRTLGPSSKLYTLFTNTGDRVKSRISSKTTITDLITELQTLAACATLSLSGGSISVDFGTGCSIYGSTISGSLSLSFSAGSGSLGLNSTFTTLTVNGITLDGTLALTLSDSVSIDSNISTTKDAATTNITFKGAVVASDSGVTLNGNGSVSSASLQTTYALTNIHFVFTSSICPDSGVINLTLDGPDVSITFGASTPTTGEVTVQYGSFPSSTETLSVCTATIS